MKWLWTHYFAILAERKKGEKVRKGNFQPMNEGDLFCGHIGASTMQTWLPW